MIRHSILLLILSSFLFTNLAAKSATSREALMEVNKIRASVKLPLYGHSDFLQRSAESHASYIAINTKKDDKELDLHTQRSGNKGFTGINATARSAKTSYPSRDVMENISFGNEHLSKSLEGLMSAIYHRFTFLDFLSDNLGYGTDKSNENIHNHVFNMGRNDMENTCRVQPEAAKPITPVDCLGTKIKPEYMNNACQNLPDEALYAQPFTTKCKNGRILKAEFMNTVCNKPPADSLFNADTSSTGAYYSLCKPKVRIDSAWFDGVCSNSNHPALHSGDNRFYEVCDNDARVNVDWFQNFCDSATPNDVVSNTSYYKDLCQTTSGIQNFDISSAYRNQVDDALYRKSPEFVIWPPLDAKEVSPVFYDEIPDPLPDLDVSGYPLSLQFNPGLITSVKVSDFKLEKQNKNNSWSSVKAVREMNQNNDPNDSFTDSEFAWFPLQRLDWGTRYRASVSVKLNGVKANNIRRKISWSFKTKTINTPLIIVNTRQKEVNVPADAWFTLYHVPDKQVSRPMREIGAEWNKPAEVESEIIDMNTIRMKFKNIRCNSVVLKMKQRSDLKLNTCG